MIPSETIACQLQQRVVGRRRLAVLAHLLGELGHLLHQRIAVREDLERQLGLVELLQPLGALLVDRGADEGLDQGAIQAEIDLRDPPHGGETALVLGVGLDDRADVVQGARLEAHDPVAADRFRVGDRRPSWGS